MRAFEKYEVQLTGHETTVKVVRWNDNTKIHIMGTFGSLCPTGTIARWDRTIKPPEHQVVESPAQVMLYNKNMEGLIRWIH